MLMYDTDEPLKRLTVQVVAPSSYIELLKEALKVHNSQKYGEKLMLTFCEHIEESLVYLERNKNAPDYIVIVLDPTMKTCIEMAEDNIRKLDEAYSAGGRICIVNGGCSVKSADMAVGHGHINVLAQKYSVILINGDVLIPEKCLNLAGRITQLATSVCGFFTGVPIVVDIPGYENVTA